VRSYLRGFLAGRDVTDGFYFTSDYPFHLPHLRELIKFHGAVVHLICNGSLRATVVSAVKKSSEGFEVKDTKKLTGVWFAFDVETANRDVAADIRRALDDLPAGVRLADYDPRETIDPGSKGVEVYTPVHEYEFKGKGRVRGDIPGVLEMHKRLSDIEAFHVDRIEISR
jgi:hypothetical protein